MFCCGHVEGPGADKPVQASDVFVNVYDITGWNTVLGTLGMGAFHSGLEVYEHEYCFGRDLPGVTGVNYVSPRCYYQHVYRETIYLGRTRLCRAGVRRLVEGMAEEWMGETYHVMRRNCNDFAEQLAAALLHPDCGHRQQEHPAWINRPCRVGLRILPESAVARVEEVDYNMFREYRERWEESQREAEEAEASVVQPWDEGDQTVVHVHPDPVPVPDEESEATPDPEEGESNEGHSEGALPTQEFIDPLVAPQDPEDEEDPEDEAEKKHPTFTHVDPIQADPVKAVSPYSPSEECDTAEELPMKTPYSPID
eukprot:Hpha_TRINITY_DN11477_c0_g1::TRINITY_DN11477_c0_g1_i1::g.137300::m.137300